MEKRDDIPQVFDKLTAEKIAEFPIATEKMSLKERRELVVNFFRFCQTFPWTPDRDFSLVRNKKGAVTDLKKGKIYGGFPYGGLGSGNIYRMLRRYYNTETGVIEMDRVAENIRVFCNQCSLGSGWAWKRVVQSVSEDWTEGMTHKKGFLRVGPYTYDDNLTYFSKKTTKDICADNGDQVMFQSYAQMKPGDGLVCFTTAGHVIMCSSYPAVAYKKNGEINGEASYLTVIDQGQRWRTMKTEDEKEFTTQGGVDRPVFFHKLLESGYLPFTFGELLGTVAIPERKISISLEKEEVTPEELANSVIESSHSLCDTYLVFTDDEGKTEEKHIPAMVCTRKTMEMKKFISAEEVLPFKGREFSIECQLSNGEYLTVYQGKLI